MGTRLHSVVMDCLDHDAQARWWAATLGWELTEASADVATVAPAGDAGPDLAIRFAPVTGPKRGKNRVHVDLGGATGQERRELVERVLDRGAHRVDIGQADVQWTVLGDPEGNEFCVLAADDRLDAPDVLAAVVIDARRPASLARFWAHASGWRISCESHLVARLRHPDRRRPTMDLVAVADATSRRSRVHLDVAPLGDGDQQAEVERLIGLGAHRIDGVPRDESRVALADPEDNPFCVRSSSSS